GGATISGGANGSGTLTLSGTQAQINAALATLSYKGNANFNGSDTLTMLSKDSAGTPLSDSDTVGITVTPVNDAPETLAASGSGNEDSLIAVTLSGSDVDGAAPASFVIGSLPANGFLYKDAAGTQLVALGETVSGPVYFKPAANWSGSTTFDFAAKDSGGLVDATPAKATVTVVAVADQPMLLVGNGNKVLFTNSWDTVDTTTGVATNDKDTSFEYTGTLLEGWSRMDSRLDGRSTNGNNNALELWSVGDRLAKDNNGNSYLTNAQASTGGGKTWLELNDATGGNVQTLGIERTVSTTNGALYTLSFDYAARVGYDASFTSIGVYLDGVLIQSYGSDGRNLAALKWEELRFSFMGDGQDHKLSIAVTGTNDASGGRGGMVDDLRLTESTGVVKAASGTTNVALKNYISTGLRDTDGSEILTLKLSGLPAGAEVWVGTSKLSANADGSVSLTTAQLASAELRLPANIASGVLDLLVTATSTEANGSTASTSQHLLLQVADKFVAASSNVVSGSFGNDTITATDLGIALTLGGASVTTDAGAAQTVDSGDRSQTSGSNDQVFDTKAGNDYVEAGSGNDTIYLGDSGSGFKGTATAPTTAQLAATVLMATDDPASLVGSNGQLSSSALNTSASDTTKLNTWADVAHGGVGNDLIHGEGGIDILYGGDGNDRLFGGAGNDALRGGAGDDLLVGGAGNDVLRGDIGVDTFKWTLGDQGVAGALARDVVTDFGKNGEKDVLDLRDLLQGENHTTGIGNLTDYLHFTKSGSDTVIDVKHLGAAGEVTQQIVLQGVDLSTLGNDAAILQNLLNDGKLQVD
ncbi:type I secretion C-terminal target domain-containing protein, partial [Craterilacuibacter sp. RT1T]|uniref:type I secretion C-terminal target domain-containing protein n=1 Tax=Craterilacuibacter sp. RT1T TaxID=2942211 RepID=UPI0024BD9105